MGQGFLTPQAVFTQPTPPLPESGPPKLKLQHSVPTCPGGQANKYLRLESANRHWLSVQDFPFFAPWTLHSLLKLQSPCLLSLPVRGLHSIRNFSSFTAPSQRLKFLCIYIFFFFLLPYSVTAWSILAFLEVWGLLPAFRFVGVMPHVDVIL